MTSHSTKKIRRSLCPQHRAAWKAWPRHRNALVLGLGLAVAGLASARANTPVNVPNGTTDLTTLGATAGSDLTFMAATTYAPTAFTLTSSSALNLGTLDDLDGTQTLTIANNSGAAATITLNGGTNSVAPDPADLLYVATGGTLNFTAGTGVTALGLTLAASGNLDIAGSASIGSIITMGANAITKTGAGMLTLNNANTGTGGFTIENGTVSTNNNNGLGSTGNTVNLGSDANNATLLFTGTPTGVAQNIAVGGTGTATIQASTTVTSGNGVVDSNTITLANTLHLAETGGGNIQFRGNITGAANSVIIDANNKGEVQFRGTNTFTGLTVKAGAATTTVSAGFGGGGVTLGDATTTTAASLFLEGAATVANGITLAAGATNSALTIGLGGSGFSTTTAGTNSGTFSGAVNLNGSNLTILNNTTSATTAPGNLTVSTGGISGTGNLTVNDNSTNTNATATAAGNITISAGINNAGTITFNDNSTSTAGSPGNTTVSGIIGASVMGITANSTSALGGLTLGGANTAYTGGVTVNGGFLQLTNIAGAGTGAISLGATTAGVLVATGGNVNGVANNISGSGYVENFDSAVATELLTGTLSYTGNTYFRAAGTINFSPSANSTLTGVIGATTGGFTGQTLVATGNIIKGGANTLTLSGNNLYTGTTTVNAGTLVLSGNNAVSATTVNAGGTLQLRNANATTGTLTMNGVTTPSALQLRADAATTFNTGAITLQSDPTTGVDTTSYTIDLGAATGSGVASTLTLGGAFGFSANTGNRGADTATVNVTGAAGYTLGLGAVADSPNGNAVTETFNVASGVGLTIGSFTFAGSAVNHNLTFSGAGNTSVTGNITRANTTRTQNITFGSTGTVTLNGTVDTGTGVLTENLNSGTVLVNNAQALLVTGSTTTNIVFGGGTLQYGSGITTDYSARIANSTSAISVDTNGNDVTFATALAATNTGGLTKLGTGSLTLSAANLYTGATTVANGKLRLTNATGSATGSGAVNLGSLAVGTPTNATISGTGTSTGLLTVVGGARIAPGVNTVDADGSGRTNFGSASTITLGSTGGITLTNASLDFDLASTAAGANDRIATGGTLTLGTIAISFNELGGSLQTGTQYTLISGGTVSGDVSGITTTAFFNGTAYTANYTTDATDLFVTFSPVPEPGTWAMMAGGFGLLWLVRLRRRSA